VQGATRGDGSAGENVTATSGRPSRSRSLSARRSPAAARCTRRRPRSRQQTKIAPSATNRSSRIPATPPRGRCGSSTHGGRRQTGMIGLVPCSLDRSDPGSSQGADPRLPAKRRYARATATKSFLRGSLPEEPTPLASCLAPTKPQKSSAAATPLQPILPLTRWAR
jgi:hypothetical protein